MASRGIRLSRMWSVGCGALTVEIRMGGNAVLWNNWLWQNDYDPECSDDFGGQMPAFTFDPEQYLEAVARSTWAARRTNDLGALT